MQNSLLITGRALGCLLLGVIGWMLMPSTTLLAQQSQPQVHAPKCSPALPWLNPDQPLTVAGLRAHELYLDRPCDGVPAEALGADVAGHASGGIRGRGNVLLVP